MEEERIVVVNAVAEQPLAVTVVKGEHVVVGIVEPLVLTAVGTHCIVTYNAVFEDMHDDMDDDDSDEDDGGDDDEVPTGELEFESLLESLLSLVSLSFSDVKSSKELSMSSTLSPLMLSVMLSRCSSMQDSPLTISPIAPSAPLFLLAPHPEELEPPPNSEMRFSTPFLIGLILSRVSDLSGVGFAFHDLMMGIRPASSEDTDFTLDVACELASVIVVGGRVIGTEYDPPLIIGIIPVLLD